MVIKWDDYVVHGQCNVNIDPDPGVPYGRGVHVQDATWGD